jgi:hypothetical protein
MAERDIEAKKGTGTFIMVGGLAETCNNSLKVR